MEERPWREPASRSLRRSDSESSPAGRWRYCWLARRARPSWLYAWPSCFLIRRFLNRSNPTTPRSNRPGKEGKALAEKLCHIVTSTAKQSVHRFWSRPWPMQLRSCGSSVGGRQSGGSGYAAQRTHSSARTRRPTVSHGSWRMRFVSSGSCARASLGKECVYARRRRCCANRRRKQRR